MDWEIKSKELLYQGPFFKLQRSWIDLGEGSPKDFYGLTLPDFCNILALTETQEVVMVRQPRFGVDAITCELPGGTIDTGEDPQAAALRELLEETGFAPIPGRVPRLLGVSRPNPAIQSNRMFHFAVGPVCKVLEPQGTEFEILETRLIQFPDLLLQLGQGEFQHALMLTLFGYLYALGLNPKDLLR